MLDDAMHSNFMLGTKQLNFENILNNFETDVNSASPFILQNYKQYINKTDSVTINLNLIKYFYRFLKLFHSQADIQLGKSISKLADYFKEHKKFIESN